MQLARIVRAACAHRACSGRAACAKHSLGFLRSSKPRSWASPGAQYGPPPLESPQLPCWASRMAPRHPLELPKLGQHVVRPLGKPENWAWGVSRRPRRPCALGCTLRASCVQTRRPTRLCCLAESYSNPAGLLEWRPDSTWSRPGPDSTSVGRLSSLKTGPGASPSAQRGPVSAAAGRL